MSMEWIRQIVPAKLFVFPESNEPVVVSQTLIEQCYPGSTKMRIQSLTGDLAEAEIPYAKENRALHGLMHGGCFFTVGDTLTAIMCIFHLEKPTQRMLTVNASMRYLRPIDQDLVRAKARLVRKTGPILDFVCDFFNAENKRAAQGKYKYALADLGAAGKD